MRTIAALLIGMALASAGTTRSMADPAVQNASTWSGYAMKGGPFTSISARWTQPAVTCPVANAQVSIWVGIDGLGDGTVEQVGTVAKCSSAGEPTAYRAFWEMYDGPSSPGGESIPVAPGDKMAASVRYAGGKFHLDVRDLTSGRRIKLTKSCTATCTRSTAEWIVERPGNGTYPLAQFTKLKFSSAEAAAGAKSQKLGSFPGLIELTMTHAGTTLSQPSAIARNGSSFDCTWLAAI